jgi:small-conductance mechanosensitive channel
MESFGVISFIVAFLFFRQRQKIRSKQKAFADALNSRVISERGDGKCFSSEWVMDNIVYRPKKLLSATPLLLVTVTFLVAVFYYVIGPRILANLVGLGYSSVIALMGIAVLLWTDAFQAYSYTNAIHEVSVEQLDKEDQSYIGLAKEAVEKAFLRFVSLGVAFALFGPFIPQVFNGVLYVLMLYTTAFFQASEVLLKVFTVLGVLIVLVLPGIMFFLPELLGRIVIRKGKPLVQRILRRMKS